jgi:asparagine synthase (glutamine-hydrolysing)
VTSDERVGHALLPRLREAVRSHLVSDVPVAVFLSGGMDSTAVAALAAEARGSHLDTFTVQLAEDAGLDEAPVAQRTAGTLGTKHHQVTIGESDALGLATKWLTSIDQPSLDGLNTYIISKAVREQGIVVALSGLGGDEMFGGYASFSEAPLVLRASRLARLLPERVSSTLVRAVANGAPFRADRLLDQLATTPSIVGVALWRRRLLPDATMEALGLGDRAAQWFLPPECDPDLGAPRNSEWAAVRAVESRFYMSNVLLRDADVFGMAHGLEIRVPLLDRDVVDSALGYARPALGARRSPNKPWLVAALGDRIPADVVGRRKRGFSLPQARWMAGPLRDAFDARIAAVESSGVVEPRVVRKIWQRFLDEPQGTLWSRAWLLAVLGEWLSRHRVPNKAAERAPDARASQ